MPSLRVAMAGILAVKLKGADMVNLGFTNVWNVTGGMVAWEKEGNELIHN